MLSYHKTSLARGGAIGTLHPKNQYCEALGIIKPLTFIFKSLILAELLWQKYLVVLQTIFLAMPLQTCIPP